MLRSEISYTILEYFRAGSIVDDERLDIRLIDSMVAIKRAEYIKQLKDSGRNLSNLIFQRFVINLSDYKPDNSAVSRRSQEIPGIIYSKTGPVIDEIGSIDMNQYIYSYVDAKHFRVVGNGVFNKDILYFTYYSPYIYAKSTNPAIASINSAVMYAAFEDPSIIPGFDVNTDDYPIDLAGVDFIKDSIYKMDIKFFMLGTADEVSDSSGDIKQ